jgi:hypothetical protein
MNMNAVAANPVAKKWTERTVRNLSAQMKGAVITMTTGMITVIAVGMSACTVSTRIAVKRYKKYVRLCITLS